MPKKDTLFVNDGKELDVCALGLEIEGVTLFPEEIRKAAIMPSINYDGYIVKIYLRIGAIEGGVLSQSDASKKAHAINKWLESNGLEAKEEE